MPSHHGAEIDIRTYGSRLVLTHTPKQDADSLDEWLSHYHHGPLILNVKEDGLEEEILALVARFHVEEAFFLDLTLPTAVRLAGQQENRFAVRFSEYEPLEAALKFAGNARWCWLDCFTHLPLDPPTYQALRKHFKLCLVSPELEGHEATKHIPEFKAALTHFPVDAVCTDFPHLWLP